MGESKTKIIKCYLVILSSFITVSSAQLWPLNDYYKRNVPRDANICHPCYELLNSEASGDVRLFGYTLVCITCGRSVRSIQRHAVERNDSMLQNLPTSHPAFHHPGNVWVWGFVANIDNVPAHPMDLLNEKITHSCASYDPPKPNFITPGRRTCEIKCYEYIWELKTRYDRNIKSAACRKELKKYADPDELPDGVIRRGDTEPGEFPHMGAVGWQASSGTWVFKCGSSLISSKFVLTAAHCSRASETDTTIADPVPKIVRLGDKNIIDVYANGVPPTDARIMKILVHPKHSPPKKYYDIALMELEHHVMFTKYIQPACLWPRFNTTSLGTEATLTGWGVVETIGRTTSPELQAAVVDLIDTTTCDKLLRPSCNRNWCGVRDNQICAGKLAGGVDACQGDSGGPLQVQIPLPITTEGNLHYIIGVTSFGIGCALPNLPGIYSRVSMYLDWIELIVWPE